MQQFTNLLIAQGKVTFVKRGRSLKKKSRIEIAREIVSYVRKEMNRPRLTESVRNGFSANASPGREKLSAHTARA